MAEVRTFRGIRYDERVAGPLSDLICPPYDVISPEERSRLVTRSSRNFVRVELPDTTAAGYREAAGLLATWRADGTLRDDAPSVYRHEHEFALGGVRATRHGVFVALRLYPADAGVVLPHERTFATAKADRLELLRATRANTSPVFGMVADRAMRVLGGATVADESRSRLGEDEHRLARVTGGETIAAFADAIRDERVYIADGHHRYETALAYANERGAPADAPERFILSYLCSLEDPGLRILATHRIVAGAAAALDGAIARSFVATPIDRGDVERLLPGIVLVRDGRFTRLEARADADRTTLPAAWRELPVAIAEELLLRAARDGGAQVTYEHDAERAIARARDDVAALLIRAVAPATLRAVADAGERLPQKTTYFHPKVPTGLVLRALDLG